jgi:uncharacterized protein YdaU (DUF1376 family)
MHYYPHHIGDYKSATMHLSNEEDLAYRRLLEMYYDTEQYIPLETQWVARRLRVGTDTLTSVLKDYFVETEKGWKHLKCDQVIADYHEMAEKNRRNGKLGGRPKANKHADVNPVGSQSVASGIPEATHSKANQEPITKTNNQDKKTVATKVACPKSVDQQVWDDWLAIRRAKKLPLTETAWKQILAEIDKSGFAVDVVIKECCLRGWAAFKVAWLKENPISISPSQAFAGDI